MCLCQVVVMLPAGNIWGGVMIAGLDYNTDIRVGVVRLLYRCLVELQSHVNRLQLNCLKSYSLIEEFCGNVGLYTVVDCIVVENFIPQCVMVT